MSNNGCRDHARERSLWNNCMEIFLLCLVISALASTGTQKNEPDRCCFKYKEGRIHNYFKTVSVCFFLFQQNKCLTTDRPRKTRKKEVMLSTPLLSHTHAHIHTHPCATPNFGLRGVRKCFFLCSDWMDHPKRRNNASGRRDGITRNKKVGGRTKEEC